MGLARIAMAAALGLAILSAASARADIIDDAPAVASPGAGLLELYATSGDGQANLRRFDASGWSDWASVATGLTSGPAVAAQGSTIHLLARGTAGPPGRGTGAERRRGG